MGGGGKSPKVQTQDTSALDEQRRQAQLDAERAQAKEERMTQLEQEREAAVKASGRRSTILAGEEQKTSLLGG